MTLTKTGVNLTKNDYFSEFNRYLNNYCLMFFNMELNEYNFDSLLEKTLNSNNERLNMLEYFLWLSGKKYYNKYLQKGLKDIVNYTGKLLLEMKNDERYGKDEYFTRFANLIGEEYGLDQPSFYTGDDNNLQERLRNFIWQYIVDLKLNKNLYQI